VGRKFASGCKRSRRARGSRQESELSRTFSS
jgi:hypothetical protein